MPQGVRDVAGQRLARMSADSRDLIELAAVGGRAARVRGAARRRAAGGGGAAARARRGDEQPHARGDARRPHRLPLPPRAPAPRRDSTACRSARRAALHLRLATALEAVHGAEDDRSVSDLALHFGRPAALGGAERAVHYALRAAELAARSFAFEEAARQLRGALDLGIADPATRSKTLRRLGGALHRCGSAPEALESYAAAAAEARALGDDALLAEAAIGFENACWRPGIGAPESVALLEEALAAADPREEPLRVRLLASLSRARAYRGDHELAAKTWGEAVETARRIGDRLGLAVTLFHAAWTRGSRSAADVLASLDEARELFTAPRRGRPPQRARRLPSDPAAGGLRDRDAATGPRVVRCGGRARRPAVLPARVLLRRRDAGRVRRAPRRGGGPGQRGVRAEPALRRGCVRAPRDPDVHGAAGARAPRAGRAAGPADRRPAARRARRVAARRWRC